MKEAENVSYDGWDPSLYPSRLLLEIEGDIVIRKRQVELDMEMINPREDQNTVVQLNMDEGKTSVITPMSAAVLGNGKNLVRILVLKRQASMPFLSDLVAWSTGGFTTCLSLGRRSWTLRSYRI